MQEILSKNKLENVNFNELTTEARILAEELKLIAKDKSFYFFLVICLSLSIFIVLLSLVSIYLFGASLTGQSFYLIGIPSSVLFSIGVLGIVCGVSGTWYFLSHLSIFKFRQKVADLLAKEIEKEIEKEIRD